MSSLGANRVCDYITHTLHLIFAHSLGLVRLSTMEHMRSNNPDLVVLSSPFSLSLDQAGSDEKTPAVATSRSPYPPNPSSSAAHSSAQWTPYSYHDSDPATTHSYPLSTGSRSSQFIRPSHIATPGSSCRRSTALVSFLRPWAPLIMYAIASLFFVIAIAFYKTELFQCTFSYSFDL